MRSKEAGASIEKTMAMTWARRSSFSRCCRFAGRDEVSIMVRDVPEGKGTVHSGRVVSGASGTNFSLSRWSGSEGRRDGVELRTDEMRELRMDDFPTFSSPTRTTRIDRILQCCRVGARVEIEKVNKN